MHNILHKTIQLFENKYLSYSYLMKANYDYRPDIDMILRYYYRAPGFVRMEMIEPFKGSVLVYNPLSKKAQVKPFPFIKKFVIELPPESKLIRSPSNHRIDESDMLTLLKTVNRLALKGEITVFKRKGHFLLVVQGKGQEVVLGKINKFVLQLDRNTLFPLYAASYDVEGEIIEEVFFEDIRIGLQIDTTLFDLKKN